ncbi:MAG: glycosyltransferase [bacterium]|nr:glycosyltransferase [bacterium]
MLTLFAMPKPFTGHNGTIQRNAMESWKRLSNVEVILFGSESGVAEAAQEFGFRHIPEVRCNEFGTPIVSDLFRLAERHATFKTLCYCNADIILPSEFPLAAGATAEHFDRFLMIGQRWDIELTDRWNYHSSDWASDLRSYTMRNGTLHNPAGIDYFCFSTGLWNSIPDFAIGRIFWDNWLVQAALESGAALVDATETIFAVHQNHDYNHVQGGREAAWNGEEAQRNKRIGNMGNHLFNVTDATWRLLPLGFIPAVKGIRPEPPHAFDWDKLMSYATSLIESGKPREALDILEQADAIETKVQGYYFARAVAHYHLQQLDLAREMCSNELKNFPAFEPAKQLLTRVLQVSETEKKKSVERKPVVRETKRPEPSETLPIISLADVFASGEYRSELHEKPLTEFTEYTPEYFRGKRLLLIGTGSHRFPAWANGASRVVSLRTIPMPILENSASDSILECVISSVEQLPFEDASFDFLYLYGPEFYTIDFDTALLEFARVLSAGGRILIVNAITTVNNNNNELWSLTLPKRFEQWFFLMGEYLTTFSENLFDSLEWHIPYFLSKPEPEEAVHIFTMQRNRHPAALANTASESASPPLIDALQNIEANPPIALQQIQSILQAQTKRIAASCEKAPDVTIAMPLYNRAKFVAVSLQSALEQKFSRRFEILIVDDGSTDNSLDVVAAFNDPRIRIVAKPHTNAPDTRNRCIVEARGEWIFWLDSDDILLPNALQTLWDAAQAKVDVDIICGDTITVDENLQDKGTLHFESWRGRNEEMLRTFLQRNPFPLGNVLMRKSVFERYGRFDPSFLRGHDMELWSRLALTAVFDNVPIETYIWRHHSGCMSPLTTKFDGSENRSTETRVARRILEQFPLPQLFPELDWSVAHEATQQAWEIAKRLPFICRDPDAVAWCEEQSHAARLRYKVQNRRFRTLHVFSQIAGNADSVAIPPYWRSLLTREAETNVESVCAILRSGQLTQERASQVTLDNGKAIPCYWFSSTAGTLVEEFARLQTQFRPDTIHFHHDGDVLHQLASQLDATNCLFLFDRSTYETLHVQRGSQTRNEIGITCYPSEVRWLRPQPTGTEQNAFILPAQTEIVRNWQVIGKEATKKPLYHPIRIALFGELSLQAGFTTVVYASLQLQQQQVPVSIDLFGSVQKVDQVDEMRRIIMEVDPEWAFFRFRSSFTPDKYPELMRGIDIVLLPNPATDKTQRIAGEYATACGIPVMVGSAEANENSKWHFPLDDIDRLAEILKRVILDSKELDLRKTEITPPVTEDEFLEQLQLRIDARQHPVTPSAASKTKSEPKLRSGTKTTTIGLFAWDKPQEACGRLRFWDPLFRAKTFRAISGYNRTDDFSPADRLIAETPPQLLYWQRHFVMVADAMPEPLRKAMEQWITQGIPLLYELDDDFATIPADNPNAPFFSRFAPAMQRYADKFTGLIASSAVLADRLAQYGKPVFLLKNQLNEKLWNLQTDEFERLQSLRRPDKIVIGWMGTPTHESDIAPLLPVFQELLSEYSGRIVLRFFGWLPPQLQGIRNVEFAATMSNDYERFVKTFCAQPFDIGIAPLQDIPFNRAKSDIKYLEYAATGAAGVYANLPGYQDTIRNRENGLLCSSGNIAEWKQAIVELIENANLRKQIAREAYREVQSTRTLAVTAMNWEAIWQAVIDHDTSYQERTAYFYPEVNKNSASVSQISSIATALPEPKKKSNLRQLTVCYFSLEPETNACPQLRVLAPLERTGAFQIDHAFARVGNGRDRKIVKSSLENPDLVLIQRDVIVSMAKIPPPLQADFTRLKNQGVKFIYELDDHFGAVPETHPEKHIINNFDECIRGYTPWLDAIVVATEELAGAMSKFGLPVLVIPNQLDEQLWRLNTPLSVRSGEVVSIGWMGTPTHAADLEPIIPILLALYEKYRDRIEFRFFGFLPRRLENHPAMKYQGEIIINYDRFVEHFLANAPDIAIAPLLDNPFNRAKSDIKYLEYAAAGCVGIYADLPPYRSTVNHRKTGLLVNSEDVSGWENAIVELLENTSLRNQIAYNAREFVIRERTLKNTARNWEVVYRSIIG